MRQKVDKLLKGSNKRSDSKCTIACTRCRVRKIRCDSNLPCNNCQGANAECEKANTNDDGRKKRYKNLYVKTLECQVNTLQNILSQLIKYKSISNSNDIDIPDSVKDLAKGNDNEDKFYDKSMEGMEPYGKDVMFGNLDPPNAKLLINSEQLHRVFRNLRSDITVMRSVENFFKWQYFDAQYLIEKDSFLHEFLSETDQGVGTYCSEELVYAICALGALLANEVDVQEKSREFYLKAKLMIFSEMSLQPSATTVKSLLCLSIYDNGYNDSSCWMLSGLAFRMGFHLEFDHFLQKFDGISKDGIVLNSENRLYWGCFIYDHYNSILLGRAVTLKVPENLGLSILNQEQLPAPLMSDCTSLNIEFTLMKMIELSILLEKLMENINIFNGTKDDKMKRLNVALKTSKLNNINVKLMKWKVDVASVVRWNKSELKLHGHDLTRMSFKYYYYLIILCFNKPFSSLQANMSMFSLEIKNSLSSSADIVEDCIDDVYISLNAFHNKTGSFKYLSLTIIYIVILSLNYFISSEKTLGFSGSEETLVTFEYLLIVLKNASKDWKIASRAFSIILTKIRNKWPIYYNEIFNKSKVVRSYPSDHREKCLLDFNPENFMDNYNIATPSTADSIIDIDDLFKKDIDFKSLDILDSNISSWSYLFPELYN
ncbi:uncharacterized protein PRCAT00001467001 [Priceomyces carsonii]|uniref:uncharacterized protein n=1 Tax=Priceomyces carsonii TaxID=28549 RepID=UPI002ED89A2B|nr:unnamed protein product [Priceomyces carsonii]